jgi:hypothetical protein
MMKKSSTAITAAPAATLNIAARRSESRERLAGLLIAFGTSEVGRDKGTPLIRSDLAACEADDPSFIALSLNERGE